ncbi:hypothetical protein LTR66_006851 [Elasticomyces elasticus]|nr:hypothetical protein LTR66_006851 [Elasticomyces elasticus]
MRMDMRSLIWLLRKTMRGSFDSTVRLWDTKSQSTRPLMTLTEAKDAISAIYVTGHQIMTGCVDGKVRMYDLRKGSVDVDVIGCPVTSITPSKANDSYLVSTLDSTIRLMDGMNGRLLQSFRDANYTNTNYRIRSTLAMADSMVISGSEEGNILVWDLLSGVVQHRLWHGRSGGRGTGEGGKQDVVSAVAWNQLRKEWVSAGGDGEVVVWGAVR